MSDLIHINFILDFRAEKMVKHCLIRQEGRLYIIGNVEFESMVELINYYEKNPLYRKICLTLPVTEELFSRLTQVPNGHENMYAAGDTGYTDPSNNSNIRARAMYDYDAQRDDELTLVKNCIITNIHKKDPGWWRGDFGGRKQHWFPANFVQELEPSNEVADGEESNVANGQDNMMPLGNLQKGSVDIVGAEVSIQENRDRALNGFEYLIRIGSPPYPPFEMAASTKAEALEWATKIRETSQSAHCKEENSRKKERALRIARELSNLVVYCRSVVFNLEKNMKRESRNHTEMSSFPEAKAEKLMVNNVEQAQMFLWYHDIQFSRVYPKAQRVDSSNYNPMPMWNVGSQMTALNFQTGDKPMQLNQGKFLQNGSSGYVLKPEFMTDPGYIPNDSSTVPQSLTILIGVNIMAARFLNRKTGRGLVSPYVEVEICGAEYDNAKFKTKTIPDNGFNPYWNDTFDFQLANPDLALLRFVVYDVDIFGDSNFIGQYTVPVRCIRTGYRSIPLKNMHSENLELSGKFYMKNY